MNQNKHYDLQYKKLKLEAILKSVICGGIIAFTAVFVLGLIFWMVGVEPVSLVLGILGGALGGVTVVFAPIFYLVKFHPTVLSNARRMDKLGLEERVITMVELENDDSCMARVQREDAIKALNQVDSRQIRFNFNKNMMVTLLICCVIGIGMSTVAALGAAGIWMKGKDFLPEEAPVYIPVSYMAEDGGYIEGEVEQLILAGGNAEAVVAIPDEGYSFEGWDDDYKKPSRTDKEIDHPLVLTAIFLPVDEEGDDKGEEESGENGEKPGEQEGESDQQGESDQPGDQESDQQGEGSGKYNKVNQIINGETYYRDFLDEYKDEIMKLLEKRTEELSEEEKALIEAYINIV